MSHSPRTAMEAGGRKTTFDIPGMDCPSEENLIRLRLSDLPECRNLVFHLGERRLDVYHQGEIDEIERRLASLGLGAVRGATVDADRTAPEDLSGQYRLLWTVLAINAGFFVFEIVTGVVSGSMGLVADSLDMLADALVYGLSLWAVGAAVQRKQRVAVLSGYLQLGLAILGLAEVFRRFFGAEAVPESLLMIGVSILALLGNAWCLRLFMKADSREVHLKASMIFTSNDVIINIGVILAGALVLLTGSPIPDLVVGSAIFLIVIRGAIRILRLRG